MRTRRIAQLICNCVVCFCFLFFFSYEQQQDEARELVYDDTTGTSNPGRAQRRRSKSNGGGGGGGAAAAAAAAAVMDASDSLLPATGGGGGTDSATAVSATGRGKGKQERENETRAREVCPIAECVNTSTEIARLRSDIHLFLKVSQSIRSVVFVYVACHFRFQVITHCLYALSLACKIASIASIQYHIISALLYDCFKIPAGNE